LAEVAALSARGGDGARRELGGHDGEACATAYNPIRRLRAVRFVRKSEPMNPEKKPATPQQVAEPQPPREAASRPPDPERFRSQEAEAKAVFGSALDPDPADTPSPELGPKRKRKRLKPCRR
jgi:hypothetical protein